MTDGYDHIGLINCAGGILAQDYEMFEIQNPHFLLKHEFATDSAGAGQWRGGLGVETEFRMDGSNVTAVCYGDGVETYVPVPRWNHQRRAIAPRIALRSIRG